MNQPLSKTIQTAFYLKHAKQIKWGLSLEFSTLLQCYEEAEFGYTVKPGETPHFSVWWVPLIVGRWQNICLFSEPRELL
jgi:hypothetical protein